MYVKKGGYIVFVVLGLLLVAGGLLFVLFSNDVGITGAVIGLQDGSVNDSFELGVETTNLSTGTEGEIVIEPEEPEIEAVPVGGENSIVEEQQVSEPLNLDTSEEIDVHATYGGSGSCGSTVTEDSTLTSDVGPCTVGGLIIGANEISLDCQGYSIYGTYFGSDEGIYNDLYDNVNISNCKIINFTKAVYWSLSTYGIFENITIENQRDRGSMTHGIQITSNANNNLVNGTTVFGAATGVNIDGAYNNNITFSNITNSSILDLSITGIDGSNYHLIANNTIERNVSVAAGTGDIIFYNNNFWNVRSITDYASTGQNHWNTTFQTKTNILGGLQFGGNFYSNFTDSDIEDDSIINDLNVHLGSNNDSYPLAAVYRFYEPTTNLEINSTFNTTNAITEGSNHSTRQNITFFNGSTKLRHLEVDAYFNETVNLSNIVINYTTIKVLVNISTAVGISPNHTLYLNDTNNANGVVVCPEASQLAEVNLSCTNSIKFTSTNVSESAYVEGIRVTKEGTEYKIENVSGSGAILGNPVCGDTFTKDVNLTEDLTGTADCLTFGASHIALDCKGYSLTGDGDSASDDGVLAQNKENVTVQNCIVQDFGDQIDFTGTNNSLVSNNTVREQATPSALLTGLRLGTRSVNNTIVNNTAFNLSRTGITIVGYDNHIEGNNVSNNSIYGIGVSSTNNITIINNTIFGNLLRGISLGDVNSSLIERNLIEQNDEGVYLTKASNHSVFRNNTFFNNTLHGFYLESDSFNNSLVNNNFTINVLGSSYDNTTASVNNSFNMSNSFGQVYWAETNLTITGDISLNNNFYLSNNSLAINSSVLGGLNSSANITLVVNDSNTTRIFRLGNFTTDRNKIEQYGSECIASGECTNQSDTDGVLVFNVSSFSSFTAQGPVRCGDLLYRDTNLTENLTTTKDCLEFAVDHITLDCKGYSLTGDASSGADDGVLALNRENITVRNCAVQDFGKNIRFGGTNGSLIENNTIQDENTNPSTSTGIQVTTNSANNTIANNTAYNLSNSGISVNGDNNLVEGNNVSNNSLIGISVSSLNNATVLNNTVFGNGLRGISLSHANSSRVEKNTVEQNQYGIYITNAANHSFIENNTVLDNTEFGVLIEEDSFNNSFINNNFTGNVLYAILDNASTSVNNTLNYTNSLGSIEFDPALNLTISGNLSFNENLLIANNSAGFNASIAPNLNASATITLLTLNLSTVNEIYQVENITNDSAGIINEGVDCIAEGTCDLQLYDNTTGTLIFTTTSFSSFAANNNPGVTCGALNADLTLESGLATTGDCFTFSADHITLDCAGFGISGDYGANDDAIFANGRKNITIRNCIITNFGRGIRLRNTDGSNVTGVSVVNSTVKGLELVSGSDFNNVTHVILINNTIGLSLSLADSNYAYNLSVSNSSDDGIYISGSDFNNITGAGSESFWDSASDGTVYIHNSDNNHFSELHVVNGTTYGATVSSSHDNTWEHSNFSGNSRGLYVTASKNNTFYNNTFEDISSESIYLTSSSSGNNFWNNNVTGGVGNYSVLDETGLSYLNTIFHNNTGAAFNATSINLTTNISLITNETIFLETNLVGLTEEGDSLALNSTTTIEIYNLGAASKPHIARNGAKCDDTDECNITSYDNTTGTFIGMVNFFSNYTTFNNTAPNVTRNMFSNASGGSKESFFTNDSNIFANISVVDQDGDNVTLNVSWYVDNVNIKNQTVGNVSNETSLVVNLSVDEYDYNKSDLVNVSILPYDYLDLTGENDTNSTTIQNTFPRGTVVFNQSVYFTEDDISVNVTIDDADAESMTVKVTWYVNDSIVEPSQSYDDKGNGSIVNDSFLAPSQYGRFSLINVSFNITDGTNTTQVWSSLVNISNSEPVQGDDVADISVTNGSSVTINLSGNFTDLDNDEINFSIVDTGNATFSMDNDTKEWTISGVDIGQVNVTFNASDGINTTESNNITIDVTEEETSSTDTSTSGGSSGGSSGGGGGGGTVPTTKEESSVSESVTKTGLDCAPGFAEINGKCVNTENVTGGSNFEKLEHLVEESYSTAYRLVLPEQNQLTCLSRSLNPLQEVSDPTYTESVEALESGEVTVLSEREGNGLTLLWLVPRAMEQLCTEINLVEDVGGGNLLLQQTFPWFSGKKSLVTEQVCFPVSKAPTLVLQEFGLCEGLADHEFSVETALTVG